MPHAPTWRGRALVALTAALLLASTATGVMAKGSKQRARALYERANVHFNLGEYREAATLYRRAYTVEPLPGFLFNIGQCHYNLGEHEKALRLYERYLIERPDAPNRADVEAQIVAAKKALAERPPASAPASQRVSPPPASAPVRRPPSRAAKIILWSGVATSAALLVTAVITRAVALDMSAEFKQDTTPLSRQLDLKDRGEALTLTSNITLAAGAALAVGTGLYYWLGYRRRGTDTVAVFPTGSGGVMISTFGTF